MGDAGSGTLSFEFNAQLGSVRGDDVVLSALADAVAGGDAVGAFLRDEVQAMAALSSSVATGDDSVWLDGVDAHTGDPTWTVVDGANALTLGVVLQEQVAPTTADPAVPTVVFAYVTLTVGMATDTERVVQLVGGTGTWRGSSIPDIDQSSTRRKFLGAVGSVVKTFVKVFVKGLEAISTDASAAAALAAGSDAAGSAADQAGGSVDVELAEGETLAMDVSITVFDVANVVISLGALAWKLVLVLLAKRLLVRLRVYNRSSTPYDVSLWVNDSRSTVPFGMVFGAPASLPQLGQSWAPPWITGPSPVPFMEVLLVNSDSETGVDGVLTCRGGGGATIGVHVPNTGSNTIAVAPGVTQDEGAWLAATGTATTHATDGDATVSLAAGTNQLAGRSPNLADGTEGYNYQVVVVIDDPSPPPPPSLPTSQTTSTT